MKKNLLFYLFKFVSFVIFSGTSAIISINMFISFSENLYERVLLIIIAFAIEVFKIFLILQGNSFFFNGKKKQGMVYYFFYGLAVGMSLIASYGFNNSIIVRNQLLLTQTPSAIELQANKEILDRLNNQLNELTSRILTQEERLKVIPETFTTQVREVNRLINQYVEQKSKIQEKIIEVSIKNITLEQNLIQEQVQVRSMANMFTLMVESFRNTFLESLKENTIKMILLMIIAVIIEVGIIMTAPKLNLVEDPPMEENPFQKKRVPRKKREPVSKTKPSVETNQDYVKEEKDNSVVPEETFHQEEEQSPQEFLEKKEESNYGLTRKRYRAGILTDEQKIFFIQFIKGLFGEESPVKLEDPYEVAKNYSIPYSYVSPFLSRLTTIKGRTGYPMIEKNFDTGFYKANYSKDYILTFLFEEV